MLSRSSESEHFLPMEGMYQFDERMCRIIQKKACQIDFKPFEPGEVEIFKGAYPGSCWRE